MVQDEAQSRLALPALAVSVLAVGTAAILIRLADAPAISVAFWRCAFGVAMLAPFALVRRERFPKGKALFIGLASGVALGAHFGLWVSSLDYTSVAASVVLVTSAPIFVAILAYLFLGERTSAASFAGILVALAGTVVIASDDSVGSAALLGNALAVLGAVTFAIYVLTGRFSRTGGVGFLGYSIVAYSAGALVLLPVGLVSGVRMWGYSGETWFWLVMLALGPQIMGHTVLNWALGYLDASVVSGAVLAEPVVSSVLAWLILSETPGVPTIIGGAVVLFGLFLLLNGYRKHARNGHASSRIIWNRGSGWNPSFVSRLSPKASTRACRRPGPLEVRSFRGPPWNVAPSVHKTRILDVVSSDGHSEIVRSGENVGPFRVGFFYGIFAALVAILANFFFLFLDPVETTSWILTATTDFLPLAALAAHIFLGIAAALRVWPSRVDAGVPYRSLLVRDAALAAAVVALMAGATNFVSTGLQATVFADDIRAFADEAAPRVEGYLEEVGEDLSDPPPIPSVEQIEQGLQPPTLRDLGSSLGNSAVGAIFLGFLGGVIGALRGRSNPEPPNDSPDKT